MQVAEDKKMEKLITAKEAICARLDGKEVEFKRPNSNEWLLFTDKQTVYLLINPQSKFRLKK